MYNALADAKAPLDPAIVCIVFVLQTCLWKQKDAGNLLYQSLLCWWWRQWWGCRWCHQLCMWIIEKDVLAGEEVIQSRTRQGWTPMLRRLTLLHVITQCKNILLVSWTSFQYGISYKSYTWLESLHVVLKNVNSISSTFVSTSEIEHSTVLFRIGTYTSFQCTSTK